ncbi:23S rRNA (uracil(747)-C(5))-methyltransferase RlmC [Demequina sp. NBRC 110057]|uniref:23S rRNA (uracil(747)-C(5))-methyltransferase RlmC n=1 Tax=Demequina sp. NBRC 110057 TaxID=1570346 RepID=UPI0009FC3433|nr:23S rRNA (uracil(747)-C(5))-methyltransferase RlmC [Demequina sp. NBRC 110057]
MQCAYWDAGVCRSCTLIETPYAAQLDHKQAGVEALLAPLAPGLTWRDPVGSDEAGFRTKAKMVVAGTIDAPTLGILDADGLGTDLRRCGLYPPALSAAFPVLAEFVTVASLEPYSVPERRGELKHILVTLAPSGGLMARFVMRSTEALTRLRKHLPWLMERLPALSVVTLNVLPEHKAVTEGDREIVLTAADTLPMTVNGVTLHLGPRSFFQTNTDVASALYRQVAAWVDGAAPASLWDLYCGVGGLALHCLAPGRRVTGVEISDAAIESARLSAAEMAAAGIGGATEAAFLAADAVAWAQNQDSAPEAVVVNPPRRGLGPDLAGWLEHSGAKTVVYSSCNPTSLARDLEAMPSYVAREARLFDMFPHTGHGEVGVLLERR